MVGKVNSIQSLGTLDGPGVRFVVFMQGCNLRCGCCHNPDTWDCREGEEFTPEEIMGRAIRFREYFGSRGGVTVSGGEPLLQTDFVRRLFTLCHEEKINTCLDTSGSILNDGVKKLLDVTDRVLLDIKYTSEGLYRQHVGCSMSGVIEFLDYLEEARIPTTLRQVIIPTLNDDDENILSLRKIAKSHDCVDGVELLPFRKTCIVKYKSLGLKFPFEDFDEPTREKMMTLEAIMR